MQEDTKNDKCGDYAIFSDTIVPSDVANEIAYPLEHVIIPGSAAVINANRFNDREMLMETISAMRYISDESIPICELRRGIPFDRRRNVAVMIGLIGTDYDGDGDVETKTGNAPALRSLATELAAMCLDVYIGMPGVHFSMSDDNGPSCLPYLEVSGSSTNSSYKATRKNLGIDSIRHHNAAKLINKVFEPSDGERDWQIRSAAHIVNYLGYAYENEIRRNMLSELYTAADNDMIPDIGNIELMKAAKQAIGTYSSVIPHISSLTDRDACLLIDEIMEIMRNGVRNADNAIESANER